MQNETNNQDKKNILLIEDDQFIRELIHKAIDKKPVNIITAETGNQAITSLNELKNDLSLILLDIILPDKNGYEILQYIAADETLKKVPVVILSNLGQQEEIDKALALGAKAYMVKAQSDIDDIVKKVGEFIPEIKEA